MGSVKIKIRVHSGKRIAAKAYPTSHPLLFVTPSRTSAAFSHTGRARFSEDAWAITHKPTGYAISYRSSVEEAKRFADLLGKSKIPWNKLRSAKAAMKYQRQYNAVVKKYYAEIEV